MAQLSVTKKHIEYLEGIKHTDESITNALYRVIEDYKKYTSSNNSADK